MTAVVAEGLRKRFGSTEALRGVDLEVPRSTVLGLLGPNGAGKTTAVCILTTLLEPDGGRAEIDGIDVLADPREARSRIGLTGQDAAVDERLTGFENLEHVGRLFHLGRREARTRATELLERFDLTDAGGRVSGGYSGGMRRRLDIAMSLVGDPSVLFLDEPTTGLDPRSRIAVWETIDELTRSGTTTLLTTQYLDEADRLADQIVVIDHGLVIARGTPADLKAQVGGEQVIVTLADAAELDAAAGALAPHACGEPIADGATRSLRVPVETVVGAVPGFVRALDAAGVPVVDVTTHQVTLDDVFFALTGRPVEPDPGDGPPTGPDTEDSSR